MLHSAPGDTPLANSIKKRPSSPAIVWLSTASSLLISDHIYNYLHSPTHTHTHTHTLTHTPSTQQENPYGVERASSKLPQERGRAHEDSFDVGPVASEGFLTILQVSQIFEKANKGEWSAEEVASAYKLRPEDAESLLRYFNNYRIETIPRPDLTPEMKFHQFHE